MNINQLRAFVEVVEHNSFSEAARVMGLTQPAVTMQVQALEADVGATLLDRQYRRVDLTEAGRVLLPHARRILKELEDVHDEIEDLADVVSGHLVVAASTTPGQYILPRLLGGFLAVYPEVGVTLRVADTSEVIELVEQGKAHVGMVGAEVRGARVEHEQLGTDELVMICPSNSRVAGSKMVEMDVLVEQPFILREEGSGTRMVMHDVMARAGVDIADLRVVMELGTNEAIVSAVEGGMGVGVVSRWVADKALELGTVALVPDRHFPVSRPLFLVAPRGTLTRAAAALVEHLRTSL